jgi:hypothetical protein
MQSAHGKRVKNFLFIQPDQPGRAMSESERKSNLNYRSTGPRFGLACPPLTPGRTCDYVPWCQGQLQPKDGKLHSILDQKVRKIFRGN